jgi:hypothetical protein
LPLLARMFHLSRFELSSFFGFVRYFIGGSLWFGVKYPHGWQAVV